MNRKTSRYLRPRKCNMRRGAAIVEFAVVAPILFILVFGMIDLGRGIMVQNLITNAARDGARAAVLEGADASTIETDIAAYLAASSVPGATATVTPNPLSSAAQGAPVTVNVQVPFSAVSWLPASPFLQGKMLEATVIMRKEVGTSTTETTEE